MSRLFVHIATGPENPTRIALGLLVARGALDSGHEVDVFIAGDGVSILRPETLELANGIGTGSIREHVDALVAGESLGGLPVTMATPAQLVELVFEADRTITY